jgi:predicted nucleic acid-binding protein
MSRVFVDTSALLALVSATDRFHPAALESLGVLLAAKASFCTTSYVLVETYALLGKRFGPQAVEAFRRDFAPLLEVTWVDAALHESALDLLQDERVRGLSLVDAASFITMRQARLDQAFTFDKRFTDAGFECVGLS